MLYYNIFVYYLYRLNSYKNIGLDYDLYFKKTHKDESYSGSNIRGFIYLFTPDDISFSTSTCQISV